MMAVREGLVQYPSGGLNMHAFLAQPESSKPLPGLLVIQEWWGLNEHIRDIARRLAKAGYVALAPDLYSRLGHVVTQVPAEANRLMQSLKPDDAMKDVQTSLAYLSRVQGVDETRVGVIGFCMGGGFALRLACTAMQVKVAIPFYGPVPPPDELRYCRCPVLYFYGGRDEWVPRQEVERLRQVFEAGSSGSQVQIYEQCAHAFFNDTRPEVYNAAAAQDAWQRALTFLKQHLQATR